MTIFVDRGITHLDLHGIKHHDVEDEILDFVYKHQDKLPLIIVCGNSNKMIEISSSFLIKKDIKFTSVRYGVLRIDGI
ncbi:MAG: hypothetical protein CMD68_03980 [Gammaproteobacteria bacterium]|nr:hypothetical protein [Gammaproteobacteria bacterium]